MRAIIVAVGVLCLAGRVAAAEPRVLERAEIAGDLVREKLLLGGCDPGSPVPAIAVYPKGAARLPLVLLMHWFQGSKEVMEPWGRELASKGFFVVAPDLYLHGERSVKGIFDRPNLPELGEEYSVFVHQTSISHSALDVPFILDDLAERPEVDAKRVGVGGFSMGAGLSLVLAWREPRVSVVASIVGAADFWWDVTKIPPGADQDAKRLSYGPAIQRLVTSLDVSTHSTASRPRRSTWPAAATITSSPSSRCAASAIGCGNSTRQPPNGSASARRTSATSSPRPCAAARRSGSSRFSKRNPRRRRRRGRMR